MAVGSPALNRNGQIVNINDSVTCLATVVSFTGVGSTAQVTAQTPLSASTVVIQANDAQAKQHVEVQNAADSTNVYACLSISGMYYGKDGDELSILGTVTAISGSGNTALLSVKLVTSGATIIVPAGACASAGVTGGVQ